MSDQARTRLAAADLDEAGTALVARWGDDHQSLYPLPLLRSECPCATCRAERDAARENPFRVLPQGGPPSSELVGMQPVGRYGIQPVWGDGHSLGIYTWEYLREICPCDECRALRKPEGPFVHGLSIGGSG